MQFLRAIIYLLNTRRNPTVFFFFFFFPAVVTWISRPSGGTQPCITAASTKSRSASSYSWEASRPPTSVSHAHRVSVLHLYARISLKVLITLSPPPPLFFHFYSQSERRDGPGCCQATEEHSVRGGSKCRTEQLEMLDVGAENKTPPY